ncbi:CwfJ C-terminus 1-domain-containing protein-like protein [Russula dissimulans]|nr:CwfJ C-terminus 1-domain-containing protein-like protein [Russula dissimulans]
MASTSPGLKMLGLSDVTVFSSLIDHRLVTGSAMGSISPLFDKILAIQNKHGPFQLALCIGDFFGPVSGGNNSDEVGRLLEGELHVPIPCYVMQGEHPLPERVIEQFSKTNGELCKNVFLLSKSAVVTTAEGLRIACIGGTYQAAVYHGSEIPHGFSSPYFTSQTVSKLLSNVISPRAVRTSSLSSIMDSIASSPLVDVLVSHDWPSVITSFSSVPLPSAEISNIGSPPIDDIIMKTKPRYIFCSGGGKPPNFWEREPFMWVDETDRVCRFIGLGAFGGEGSEGRKQRWFYAFAILPQVQMTATSSQLANTTSNPFTDITRTNKRPMDRAEGETSRWESVPRPLKRNHRDLKATILEGEQGKPPQGYRCRRCDGTDRLTMAVSQGIFFVTAQPGIPPVILAVVNRTKVTFAARVVDRRTSDNCNNPRRATPREIGPDECWFCLSNPALAKHLIVAVGGECYLTLPKGQLLPTKRTEQREFEGILKVPGGGHVLIVPIAHFATLGAMPAELHTSVMNECERYQAALRELYAKYDATAVFFELGRVSTRGGHAHIQAVPVPLSLEDRVESAFRNEGKLMGVEFDVEEASTPRSEDGAGYFRVELPSGRRLVHRMRSSLPFSMQFGRYPGRKVLASLLNVEERVDWKNCLSSEEDDKADVRAFKTAFAPFDPLP